MPSYYAPSTTEIIEAWPDATPDDLRTLSYDFHGLADDLDTLADEMEEEEADE